MTQNPSGLGVVTTSVLAPGQEEEKRKMQRGDAEAPPIPSVLHLRSPLSHQSISSVHTPGQVCPRGQVQEQALSLRDASVLVGKDSSQAAMRGLTLSPGISVPQLTSARADGTFFCFLKLEGLILWKTEERALPEEKRGEDSGKLMVTGRSVGRENRGDQMRRNNWGWGLFPRTWAGIADPQ